jgi:hypothetical protein
VDDPESSITYKQCTCVSERSSQGVGLYSQRGVALRDDYNLLNVPGLDWYLFPHSPPFVTLPLSAIAWLSLGTRSSIAILDPQLSRSLTLPPDGTTYYRHDRIHARPHPKRGFPATAFKHQRC